MKSKFSLTKSTEKVNSVNQGVSLTINNGIQAGKEGMNDTRNKKDSKIGEKLKKKMYWR